MSRDLLLTLTHGSKKNFPTQVIIAYQETEIGKVIVMSRKSHSKHKSNKIELLIQRLKGQYYHYWYFSVNEHHNTIVIRNFGVEAILYG